MAVATNTIAAVAATFSAPKPQEYAYSYYTNAVTAFAFPSRAMVADAARGVGSSYGKVRLLSGGDVEIGLTTNVNTNTNGPSTWQTLTAGGQEAVCDVNQIFLRPAAARVVTPSAATIINSGNTAQLTINNHGLTTGDRRTFESFRDNSVVSGSTPTSRKLNQAQVAITVVDANTITYPLAVAAGTGSALVTTIGTMFDASAVVEIEMKAAQ